MKYMMDKAKISVNIFNYIAYILRIYYSNIFNNKIFFEDKNIEKIIKLQYF